MFLGAMTVISVFGVSLNKCLRHSGYLFSLSLVFLLTFILCVYSTFIAIMRYMAITVQKVSLLV